jgi:hypothetical protein
MAELLPGVFWIQSSTCHDFLKANNVSVVVGNKITPNKYVKTVKIDVKELADIDAVVACVWKLYVKNITCALSFDKNDLQGLLMARIMGVVCKIESGADVDELLKLNYGIVLSANQKNILTKLSKEETIHSYGGRTVN